MGWENASKDTTRPSWQTQYFSMCLHEALREVGSAVQEHLCGTGVAATALVDNLKRGHQAAKKAVASSSTASPGDVLTASSAFKGIQSAADGACSLIEAAFARIRGLWRLPHAR